MTDQPRGWTIKRARVCCSNYRCSQRTLRLRLLGMITTTYFPRLARRGTLLRTHPRPTASPETLTLQSTHTAGLFARIAGGGLDGYVRSRYVPPNGIGGRV